MGLLDVMVSCLLPGRATTTAVGTWHLHVISTISTCLPKMVNGLRKSFLIAIRPPSRRNEQRVIAGRDQSGTSTNHVHGPVHTCRRLLSFRVLPLNSYHQHGGLSDTRQGRAIHHRSLDIAAQINLITASGGCSPCTVRTCKTYLHVCEGTPGRSPCD